jgi:hypothetical protein
MIRQSFTFLIAIFIALTGASSLNAQNVTLGPGTSTGNSGVLMATNTSNNNNYSRVAAIYEASEIKNAGGTAGLISKIWWNKTGTGEYTTPDAHIKIYMRHVTNSIHSASTVVWANELVGDTVCVFQSTTWSIPTGTGWKEVAFTTPFNWNGNDNLEIMVEFHRPSPLLTAISWTNTSKTNANAARVNSAAIGQIYPVDMARNSTRPDIQLQIVDPLADDMSVFKIVTPTATINPGLDSVSVKLINRGGMDVYSVDVEWEINGALQAPVSLNYNPPLVSTDSTDVIKLGNYTFTPGNHFIRVWTKNPNNTADKYTFNDTLTTQVWVPYPALSGNYTINPNQPTVGTNFNNFTDAFKALNESGISGSVNFDVLAGSTFNENNLLLQITGTATDSIVFKKSGNGANPIIYAVKGTSSSTSRDFMIGLEGSDYVVFDGIDLSGLTASTTTADRIEFGYALFRKSATDGAQHNAIRNSKISLDKAHTSGIGILITNTLPGSSSAVVATTLSGTNSYNKIYNDSIFNVQTGISIAGSNDTNFYDLNNLVGVDGANVIYDYTSSSSSLGAIHATYQNNIKINNNIINSGIASSAVKGINAAEGVNSNLEIDNNTITIATSSSSGTSTAIISKMGITGHNNVVSITNNKIINSSTNGALVGMHITGLANTLNITNNLIANDTARSGDFQVIYLEVGTSTQPTPTANIHHNTITNIARVATSTGQLNAIRTSVSMAGSIVDIAHNTLSNLTNTLSVATVPSAGVYISGTGNVNIHHNNIHNIRITGATGGVTGVNHFFSTNEQNVFIYNNFIHNLFAENTNHATAYAVSGIFINNSNSQSATANIFHNTIYLKNIAQGNISNHTAGIYVNSVTKTEMANNIVINKSIPGSNGGFALAYRRTTNAIASYDISSNNNIFHIGATGNRRYVYYDGTDSAVTINAYKNAVSPRDNSSLSTSPTFIDTVNVPFNLHIDSLQATPVEGAGKIITSFAVTTDYDGDIRDAQTPDIGADEGNFISGDFEGPVISYVPLKNTSNLTDRTLDVVIKDISGINTTGLSQPLLYYRKAQSTYVSVPAMSQNGDTFTFVINNSLIGGVYPQDVIEYYVAAQDLSTLQNVSTLPDGGDGNNPPGNIAPTTPNAYTILETLNGAYYVGTNSTIYTPSYATLTEALQAYENQGMSGAVEFILIDTLYNESTGETFPLVIAENPDASDVNTLTIKPADNTKTMIKGAAPNRSSIIKMYGSDYVTIDGLNQNNSSLSIHNEAAIAHRDSNNAVIWLATLGGGNGATYNTIKNTTITGVAPSLNKFAIFSGSDFGTGLAINVVANNHHNTIDSNNISNAFYGVMMFGNSTSEPAIGNKIRYNKFGATYRGEGIYMAGIQLNRQDSAEVSYNDIQNIFGSEISNSDGNRFGINLLNTKNSIVSYNNIHNIKFGGQATCEVRGISTTSFAYKTQQEPSNNTIANNIIYDLENEYYAVNVSVSGINLSDGYGDKVYYNTIHLSGRVGSSSFDGSAAISFGYSSIFGNSPASGTNAIIRNNILSLTGNYGPSSLTKKLYAYSAKATTISNNTFSNNIIYTNSNLAASGLGRVGTTDYNTLTDWQTITGSETGSLVIDPQINADTILVPNTSSPALGAGVPISGFTTDFIGDVRSLSTPSIGAYENGADYRKPDISINPIANTLSLNNLTTVNFATITDWSGIDVTAGNKPRLYYKKTSEQNVFTNNTLNEDGWKWVESISVDTPFNFTIDYSLLFGGSVNVDDTIEYFVVAQDNATVPNVSGTATFAQAPTSVNLGTSNFPVSTENYYLILAPTSGLVYVGVNQQFTSLTNDGGFFESLTNGTILSGDVTVIITSDLTENGTHEISTWDEVGTGGYNITFRPEPYTGAKTISGNASNGLIRVNGSKNLTFEGIDTMLLESNNLVFINSSGPVFQFTNNASNNNIRACYLISEVSATNAGIITLGNGGIRHMDISNNKFSNVLGFNTRYTNGIYSNGINNNPNSDIKVFNNRFINFSNAGILVTSTGAGNNWHIVSNHFYDSVITSATTAITAISVSLSSTTGHRIDSNFVGGTSVYAGGSKWVNDANASFDGIAAGLGSGTIKHNVITNIVRTNIGTSAAFSGIVVSGGAPEVAYNVIGDSLVSRAIELNGAAVLSGIEISSGTTIHVHDNMIANIATDSVVNSRLRGILSSISSSSSQTTISNNTVKNLFTTSNANSLAVGNQALAGMYIYSNGGTMTVHKNTIHTLESRNPNSDANTIVAAFLINKSNTTLSANQIYNIKNLSTYAPATPSSVVGVMLYANANNNTIVNNMISLGHDTVDNVRYVGIWNYANITSNQMNILHNSISLYGQAGDTVPSYIIFRGTLTSNSINSNINAVNNIFESQRTGIVYAIANTSSMPATGWGAQSWDKNIYSISFSSSFAKWGNTDVNSFTDFKTISEKDSNSLSLVLSFVNNREGDLHLLTNLGDMQLAGRANLGINTDFDGETRIMPPYIGADENTFFPLPVSLTAFNANATNKNDALVSWITASERNTSHFVVEASANGKNFEAVNEVKAKGNSSVNTNYAFTHKNAAALAGANGIIYYRLTSVDFDSKKQVSKIIAVNFNNQTSALEAVTVFPNPFTEQVSISIPAINNAQAEISIIDMQGKLISNQSYNLNEGSNIIDLNNFTNMKPGIYFIKINTMDESKVMKVMKQ